MLYNSQFILARELFRLALAALQRTYVKNANDGRAPFFGHSNSGSFFCCLRPRSSKKRARTRWAPIFSFVSAAFFIDRSHIRELHAHHVTVLAFEGQDPTDHPSDSFAAFPPSFPDFWGIFLRSDGTLMKVTQGERRRRIMSIRMLRGGGKTEGKGEREVRSCPVVVSHANVEQTMFVCIEGGT